MMEWITGNLPTIIGALLVAAAFAAAVAHIIRSHRKGESCSCGSSCSGCPMSGECHK